MQISLIKIKISLTNCKYTSLYSWKYNTTKTIDFFVNISMGFCFKDSNKRPWCSWKVMWQLIATTLVHEKYRVVFCKGEGMFSSPGIFIFNNFGMSPQWLSSKRSFGQI